MITLTSLAERRLLPDRLVRLGMRRLLAQRLADSQAKYSGDEAFAQWLRTSDAIAVGTDEANAQHYEVPPAFFEQVLGDRLKYSCGLWDSAADLDASEVAMLRLTCQRAQLHDGQRILELGCGWGSLSLWMAQHYPNCQIVAMSNSFDQRKFIQQRANEARLNNLEVLTANIADFQPRGQFERVVSVEMFEHVRNYDALLKRIASCLSSEGRLFVHIFCHRTFAYPFDEQSTADDASNWMTRHFFTGGVMPSFNLLKQFGSQMQLEDKWWLGGEHYAATCEAWLDKLDGNPAKATQALEQGKNPTPLRVQIQRWRMFFMACAELFAYDDGKQWGVGHYLFKPRSA